MGGDVQADAGKRQPSPQQRTDHWPRLPKPAKRKAPASLSQSLLSSTSESDLDIAQPHAVSEHSPGQLAKKRGTAPFAAAACLPALGSRCMVQSSPEDDDMQYPGESTLQAVAAPEQLQPPLTAQPPVHAQPMVPAIAQLPVDVPIQAGSFEAESTAMPDKSAKPSSRAQLLAGPVPPAISQAGPSCAAVLEVRSSCQAAVYIAMTSWQGQVRNQSILVVCCSLVGCIALAKAQ